jgi:hypothetical protein
MKAEIPRLAKIAWIKETDRWYLKKHICKMNKKQ